MSKYKVSVKLVKVIPGYFIIDAQDAEEAKEIALNNCKISDMICNENEIYEDIISDNKEVKIY